MVNNIPRSLTTICYNYFQRQVFQRTFSHVEGGEGVGLMDIHLRQCIASDCM